MTPTLSLLMVTQARPWAIKFLETYIVLGQRLSAEVVIGAHGDDAKFWCQANAPLWTPVEGDFYEALIDPVFEMSTGDYVLRIDDDERCSPAMEDWLERKLYLQRPNWEFARASLWPDEQHYISEWLFPDVQCRLSIRNQFKRPARLHQCSLHKRWVAPVMMEHHSFLVKTKEERRAITCRYAALEGKPVPEGHEHLVTVLPEDYTLATSVYK